MNCKQLENTPITSYAEQISWVDDFMEKVLKCHFDENEVLLVLNSQLVSKYSGNFLDELTPFS